MRPHILSLLATKAQLAEYRRAYAEASGYHVALDYLERSVVYGLRLRGRLVGGVVMSTLSPLRTLQRIPEPDRSRVEAMLDLDDTVELTCVWLAPSARRGALSALFWFGLFLETSRHGVRTVLFGTESYRLHRLYLLGKPDVLYSGPVVVDGQELTGWIFRSPVAHRWPALARMTVYKTARDLRRRLRPAAAATVPAQREHRATTGAEPEPAP